jgi:hypothetical protein
MRQGGEIRERERKAALLRRLDLQILEKKSKNLDTF